MLSTIVVGVIFAVVFILAVKKTKNDVKNNKCASCSGCKTDKKNCHKITNIEK